MTIRVDVFQGVIARICIKIPLLRVTNARPRHKRRVRAGKPPLRRGHIPGPEIIQPRLGIPFLGGTTRPSAGIVQASGDPGHGVGDSDGRTWAEGGV